MKRLLTLFLFISLLLLPPTAAIARPAPAPAQRTKKQEVTVYVTRTGERYHRPGCQHLRRSKIPTTLSGAKANGYTPCKVCRPAR